MLTCQSKPQALTDESTHVDLAVWVELMDLAYLDCRDSLAEVGELARAQGVETP
jgi:hypothetical protein